MIGVFAVLLLLGCVVLGGLWVLSESAKMGVDISRRHALACILLVLATPIGLVAYVYGVKWGLW